MIKRLMIDDVLTPEQLRECEEAFAVEPGEGPEISDGLLNALEFYLALKVNPECDKFDYDEAAAGVIVTAFQVGYLKGGRAALSGKFKEPQK